MVLFRYAFLQLTLIDIADIFIISVLIYSMLYLIRGTRSLSMALGLMLILLLAFLSSWLNMEAINWLIGRLAAVWLLAFIVLFQPEFRSMLTAIGNSPIIRWFLPATEEQNIDDLIHSLEILQKASTGALIVIKREISLSSIEQTGKPINAKLTPELLVTLFAPLTPLHDGAVIVENNVIKAAACQLPMTDNPKYQVDLGMRHRAGIGLSEESDAVSIIVSEETGSISMALRGHLRRDLPIETLRKLLDVILSHSNRK
ncbi:MAG: diadenylate cyclase CdaA [Candidatus Zixiibacteriota bacterium]